jgi:hypothetical protein
MCFAELLLAAATSIATVARTNSMAATGFSAGFVFVPAAALIAQNKTTSEHLAIREIIFTRLRPGVPLV